MQSLDDHFRVKSKDRRTVNRGLDHVGMIAGVSNFTKFARSIGFVM